MQSLLKINAYSAQVRRLAVISGLTAMSLLIACSGDDGADGAVGANALVIQTLLEPTDSRCANGGVLTESGTDTNGNGELDDDEVSSSSVLCNGEDGSVGSGSLPFEPGYQKPNIILIVADDVGIDQFASQGFGGLNPPSVPTLDALARGGVSFANAWSNPTCSASRVSLFTGRYPTRTQVNTAIVSVDLANSQMSPYEQSLPKVLARSGYTNAYIGKIHASGSSVNPNNFPMGEESIVKLGWDFFAGYFDGGPFPIDRSAGLTNRSESADPYSCGFIPASDQHPQGADTGACYTVDGSCEELSNQAGSSAGKHCLDRGGILDPNNSCRAEPPDYVDFSRQNAYYTANLVFSDQLGTRTWDVLDSRTRQHRTQLETDLAIDWIEKQKGDQPWMLTLGYSAAHAPLQPVPDALLGDAEPLSSGISCTGIVDIRDLMDQNLTAIDTAVSRLLTSVGVMTEEVDGSLRYNPASNTVVAFIGDNGSLGTTVKAPFVPQRAKASAYQGGIWVPMMVATPQITEPGRLVHELTNIIDLYELFATLGEQRLSSSDLSRLDVQPLSPYLTDTETPSQRTVNFSYSGRNIQTQTPGPCVIVDLDICLQVFPQEAVCSSEGGDWYGSGGVVAGQSFDSCCAVNEYLEANSQSPVAILAESQAVIRNDQYKLLRFEEPNCAAGGTLEQRFEMYRLEAGTSNPEANLDNFAVNDLLRNGTEALTDEERNQYELLSERLDTVLAGEPDCPGDGNMDYVVDDLDLEAWAFWAEETEGQSSWYDFNYDGLTDNVDRQVIEDNMGVSCVLPQ